VGIDPASHQEKYSQYCRTSSKAKVPAKPDLEIVAKTGIIGRELFSKGYFPAGTSSSEGQVDKLKPRCNFTYEQSQA